MRQGVRMHKTRGLDGVDSKIRYLEHGERRVLAAVSNDSSRVMWKSEKK